MPTHFRPLLVVVFVVFANGCGQPNPTEPPFISFDAGTRMIDGDREVKHDFVVTNPFLRPVRILEVVRSCTCLEAKTTKETLAPSESCTLSVATSVPLSRANNRLSTFLRTDHPEFPEWRYDLEYLSLPRAEFVEPNLIVEKPLRLRVPGSEVKDDESLLKNHLDVFWLDNENPPPKPSLQLPTSLELVSMNEVIADPPPQGVQVKRYAIVLRIKNLAITGDYFQNVAVQVGKRDTASAFLAIRWRVAGILVASPEKINFGQVKPGESKTIAVAIRSLAGKKPIVLGTESDVHCLRITSKPGKQTISGVDKKTHILSLVLEIPKGESKRFLSGQVLVRGEKSGDASVANQLEIPWCCFVAQ